MRLPQPWMLGTFYACSEIILAMTRRSRTVNPSQDRHSLRILWVVIVIAVFGSIFAADAFRFASLPYRQLSVAGVILFAAGIIFRWYAILRLGRFFTVDVSISPEHRIIDTGPYRFIRHPSYTGALLAFVGYGLCLRNWVSLLVLLVPIILAFSWRIRVEERALVQALGEGYVRYSARTKRLIPFVY